MDGEMTKRPIVPSIAAWALVLLAADAGAGAERIAIKAARLSPPDLDRSARLLASAAQTAPDNAEVAADLGHLFLDVRALKGLLRRPDRRSVKVEDMDAAIARLHRKRR